MRKWGNPVISLCEVLKTNISRTESFERQGNGVSPPPPSPLSSPIHPPLLSHPHPHLSFHSSSKNGRVSAILEGEQSNWFCWEARYGLSSSSSCSISSNPPLLIHHHPSLFPQQWCCLLHRTFRLSHYTKEPGKSMDQSVMYSTILHCSAMNCTALPSL